MEIRTAAELDDLTVWSAAGVWSVASTRGTIVGSAHTHPGRFNVLWEGEPWPHPTSLRELVRVSASAELWLAGFLSGHSPDPHELFGDDIGEMSEAQRDQWLDVCREFQQTCAMPAAWFDRREVEVERILSDLDKSDATEG